MSKCNTLSAPRHFLRHIIGFPWAQNELSWSPKRTSSADGHNFSDAQNQLPRREEQNYFSGLEIYFKALEIYFSGLEIYFKTIEKVFIRAAKDLLPRRKEIQRA